MSNHPKTLIFDKIKERLEDPALPDLGIDTVGVWLDSVNRNENGDGVMFQTPSVFIEFPNNIIYSDGSYHNQYSDNLLINIHVVTNAMDEEMIGNWDFCQLIHERLSGYRAEFGGELGGFNELRKREEADNAWGYKQHYDQIITYMTNLSDGSVSRDKTRVDTPYTIHVNKEGINNG